MMIQDADKSLEARGFGTRAAREDDVEIVVDLINAAALNDTGRVATNREEKLIEWGLPQFCPETDTLLVLAPEGRPVGFVELWDEEPFVRKYLWGRVHPDYRGRGIGNRLMAWAEARARQSLDKAPPEARVSVHTSTLHENRPAHELFEARGYTPARFFFRMLIEMEPGAPPPPPVWPEGVRVRPFVLGQDDRAVHATINEAFKDHWGFISGETFEEWLHWIKEDEQFDPSVCFVAVTGETGEEQIVGVLMSRPQWEEDASVAWIDELGVLRPWRRRGIARALLHQAFGKFHRRARYKVGLGVDGGSLTGATRLYEQASMRIFQQNDAYEKILRPGVDLSTQALGD
jgi:mycothiol synthase